MDLSKLAVIIILINKGEWSYIWTKKRVFDF